MFVSLSWLEIKYQTRHCQVENSSTFNQKMCKKEVIKTVNLQMKINELTGQKVLKQLFNFLNFWVCASFSMHKTGTDCNDWLNLGKFDFFIHF